MDPRACFTLVAGVDGTAVSVQLPIQGSRTPSTYNAGPQLVHWTPTALLGHLQLCKVCSAADARICNRMVEIAFLSEQKRAVCVTMFEVVLTLTGGAGSPDAGSAPASVKMIAL